MISLNLKNSTLRIRFVGMKKKTSLTTDFDHSSSYISYFLSSLIRISSVFWCRTNSHAKITIPRSFLGWVGREIPSWWFITFLRFINWTKCINWTRKRSIMTTSTWPESIGKKSFIRLWPGRLYRSALTLTDFLLLHLLLSLYTMYVQCVSTVLCPERFKST